MNSRIRRQIDAAIEYGLDFIHKAQDRSGSFAPGSPDDAFATALVLIALEPERNDPRASAVIARAEPFLRRTLARSAAGGLPLLASSAILSAIKACALDPVAEEDFAAYVRSLIAAETKTGGPYAEKAAPGAAPDAGLNAVIADTLARYGIALDPLDAYLAQIAKDGAFASAAFKTPALVPYFIAGAATGPAKQATQNALGAHAARLVSKKNSLDAALAASALLKLGTKRSAVRSGIEHLLADPERSWRAKPALAGDKAGKKALVVAFAVEALSRYASLDTSITDPDEEDLYRQAAIRTAARAEARFAASAPLIKETIAAVSSRLRARDTLGAITLTPTFWNDALGIKRAPARLASALSEASLLAWIGYTIQDDIIDGDLGTSRLPAANAALRAFESAVRIAAPDAKSAEIVAGIIKDLDDANAEEARLFRVPIEKGMLALPDRLPEYPAELLYKKSLPHAIGPMLISKRVRTRAHVALARTFFEAYLSARQLNDDAHDWLDDLSRGVLTPANIPVLAIWKARGNDAVSVTGDADALRKIFWDECIGELSASIRAHVARARAALAALRFKDDSFFVRTLEPLEHAADKAVEGRASAARFMHAFSK